MISLLTLSKKQMIWLVISPLIILFILQFLRPAIAYYLYLWSTILLFAFWILFILLWLYQVGIKLHTIFNRQINTNTKAYLFKSNAYFIVFYFVVFVIYSKFLLGSVSFLGVLFLLIIHIYAMFSVSYTLYFVAKYLVSVERNKNATFSEFSTEFACLFMFPFRIWNIFDRISSLVK